MSGQRNMSFRKRKRSSTVARLSKYNKKTLPINRIISVPGRDLIPVRMLTHMTYSATYTLTCTLGTTNTYTFRGNGPFDPDVTGGGFQPPGYDQIATWYGTYAVISSTIDVLFSDNSTVPIQCFILNNQVAVDPGSYVYDLVKQTPGSKSGVCAGSPSTEILRMKNSANSKEVLGLNPYTDDSCQANFTGLPVSQWYWIVGCRPIDRLSTAIVYLDVTICYKIYLSDRKVVTYS